MSKCGIFVAEVCNEVVLKAHLVLSWREPNFCRYEMQQANKPLYISDPFLEFIQ